MAIDMAPFFSQIVTGGIVVMAVSIAAALAVVVIARTGAGQVLRMLFDKCEDQQREQKYQARYEREQRNGEYRSWRAKKTQRAADYRRWQNARSR